ncbi:MAG TPA: toxin-antitoxin system HicB family antitoxin, partial [Nocardioidaceae bacterium]|nr:toxin-antitoxin system HicB family antitoxin [Nocardioidaceae bacterium]
MDITHFVENLRRDLSAAAEAGGEEARTAAARLSLALDPAVRLTLMDALSEAASEITNELQGTSVEVRLKGREPIFVVVGAPAPAPTTSEPEAEPDADLEDEPVVRITLRLPESVKARAEELAARRGQSLNTWLVNAARLATAAHFN